MRTKILQNFSIKIFESSTGRPGGRPPAAAYFSQSAREEPRKSENPPPSVYSNHPARPACRPAPRPACWPAPGGGGGCRPRWSAGKPGPKTEIPKCGISQILGGTLNPGKTGPKLNSPSVESTQLLGGGPLSPPGIAGSRKFAKYKKRRPPVSRLTTHAGPPAYKLRLCKRDSRATTVIPASKTANRCRDSPRSEIQVEDRGRIWGSSGNFSKGKCAGPLRGPSHVL